MMPYRTEIETAAAAHGLDADMVAAVVEQESNGWASAFRFEPDFWAKYLKNSPTWQDRLPREVSASYGLMQTMFPVAVEHGFTGQPWELFAPALSLEFGCRVLAKLLTWAEGNVSKALGAYNAGKGGAESTNGRKYAREVMMRWERIRTP
jgi:soluble lytic murein transglycosylase-like protein